MAVIKPKRGTKAALDALAGSAGLLANELYYLTDEKKFAIGLTTTTYEFVESGNAAPTPLQLGWEATHFYNHTATTNQPFTGTAVSSGTSNAASASSYEAKHPGHTRVTSSTTANGGYRWQTTRELRGGAGLFTRAILYWEVTTNVTVRGGFHDSATVSDAVDGAYFEVVGTTVSFKTASNSTRSTHGTTYTITTGVWYTFDVEYLTDSSVELTISTDDGTIVYQQTLATNVPNSAARTFFAGVVATESTTTANQMIWIDYLGLGPAKPDWAGAKGDQGDPGATGASGVASVTVEDVTGTSYTFVTADAGKYKNFTNGSAVTATLNSGVLAAGAVVYLRNSGAGIVTIVSGTGAPTIVAPFGGTLVSAGQNASMALVHIGSETHHLMGQTEPV